MAQRSRQVETKAPAADWTRLNAYWQQRDTEDRRSRAASRRYYLARYPPLEVPWADRLRDYFWATSREAP